MSKTQNLAFLLLALASFQISSAGAAFQAVVASGRAPLVEDNLPASREMALNEARLAAIGKAVGKSLWSESYMDKDVTVRKEILSRISGLIVGEEVVEEFARAGFYIVTIRAQVADERDANNDHLRQIWVQNAKQGYPRLIVSIVDAPGQETQVAGEAGAQLRNRLLDAGFVVRSGFGKTPTWAGQSGEIEGDNAAIPAREGEIAIKGIVSTADQGREPFGIFESAEASLTVRVEKMDTGEQLASKVVCASGVASTGENARRKSAEVAADLAADYLVQTVFASWIDESCNGTRCEMLVSKLSSYPGQLLVLKNDLLRIPGMVSVKERGWEKDQAELWLVYRGSAQNLRDLLLSDKYRPRSLKVLSFTPNRIIAEWEER